MKIEKILLILVMFLVFSIQVIAISDFTYVDDYIVSYEHDEIEAGEKFTLKISVENDDNSKKENVEFELDANYPIKVISDEDWDIGDLEQGESKSRTFRLEVDDDADGNYDIEFNLEDDDDYDGYIDIEVSSNKAELIIGDIRSEPLTIFPNTNEIELFVDIENIGDKDAEYVKSNLILPEGFTPSTSYSDIENLGIIKAGERKTALFLIDSDENLNENLYYGYLELEYKSNNNKKYDTLQVELPVQGIPQFSISNIRSSKELIQGNSLVLSFDVTNIGEKEAKDITIKAFEKSEFPFEFQEKTSFVGTLNKGMTGTATFTMNIDKDAIPKDYIMTVQIRSVYDGDVLVSEESMFIGIQEYERDIKKTVMYILILIAILVMISVIYLYRKK